ncbi:hypothetical protein GQ457_11G018910 [Hibiscus cannabinus]
MRRVEVETLTGVKGRREGIACFESRTISYHDFIDFSLNETKRHTRLLPSPLQAIEWPLIILIGSRKSS